MRALISGSRFVAILAVLGNLLAFVTLLIVGLGIVVRAIAEFLQSGFSELSNVKELAFHFVEAVDLFLLAMVFYIIALGLYELFVDDNLVLPHWLVIKDLDDLKAKLCSVVIVLLGVLFLGQVVSWDGERNLMPLGLAIAAVVAALTYFLSAKGRKRGAE